MNDTPSCVFALLAQTHLFLPFLPPSFLLYLNLFPFDYRLSIANSFNGLAIYPQPFDTWRSSQQRLRLKWINNKYNLFRFCCCCCCCCYCYSWTTHIHKRIYSLSPLVCWVDWCGRSCMQFNREWNQLKGKTILVFN